MPSSGALPEGTPVIANLFETLAWLPRTPADFRQRLREAMELEAPGAVLRGLATHALDAANLRRLSLAVAQLTARGTSLAPLAPFKLGVLGNGTLDLIVPALVGSALRHGVALQCVTVPYGLYPREILDPRSAINRAGCDAVLLALDTRALPLQAADDPRSAVAASLDMIDGFRESLRRHGGTTSIVQTLAPFPEALFGSADRRITAAPRYATDAFNRDLVARLENSPDILFDVAGLAETVGLARWHCPAQWNIAKLPFADCYAPLYADHVGRLLAATRGKARRCLVLDLDNTVWGGVIGDDGLEGIAIAEGHAVGEAFRAVQRLALDLRGRGIVLAVSSKNDDAVARRAFRDHPDMLLRENHLAVFQANWNDKASNIKAIAEELALGLESFVFVDDNPVERGVVRRLLPEVAVPELPDDPAYYARTLAAAGYFESIAFSEEDRRRADLYQRNAERVALRQCAGDLSAYYASLDMEIQFAPFDPVGRARIVQLINKSNQFNLTTRRYSEAEVATLEQDPTTYTLQVRLTDVFGDNGMISVVICRPEDEHTWAIDTWLMSCRVLGRSVEQMVLRELILAARERGIERLVGRYIPSGRNAMVADHYATLGFSPDGDAPDGKTWVLDAALPEPAPTMKIMRAPALTPAVARPSGHQPLAPASAA
jgi:FkbH-like protein